MRKNTVIIIICFLLLFSFFASQTSALECGSHAANEEEIKKIEQDCIDKINQSRQQANTLSSQIKLMDSQINLTLLKIQETEDKIIQTQKEIDNITTRIAGLDTSLDYLSKTLLKRVIDGYKQRSISLLNILLASDNASELLNKIKYQKTAQENNQRLIIKIQELKNNFEEQKKKREEKKVELDSLNKTLIEQKNALANQKAAKQKLLIETQNSEQIYQRLLAQAQQEYASIKGIIAGSGTEVKIREVKKGETIASIIPGASCNSSGKHLHFMIKSGNSEVNPFNYLKNIDYRNCSGSSCDSSDGDIFNPSGNLDWPISGPIVFFQGYGNTWAVRHTWVGRIYSFHNGIDIVGASDNIQAIDDGELYRGSYGVGCALPYVKLVHKNSNLTSYYLHVYSN
jgi:peptidoglycan hydrolase CwlO-like protein